MALRMEGLDERIAESAKEEFITYGYKDASINRIAKNAGATSGAIYIRYKNKDEIFRALVDPVIKGMEEQINQYKGRYSALGRTKSWDELTELDREIFDWLIDYMFDHHDAFKLLVCKSDGSTVSTFAEDLIQFKFQRTFDFVEKVLAPLSTEKPFPVSKETLALLSSAQYHSLFEVIHHDYSKAAAKEALHAVRKIYVNGLRELLKDFLGANESGTGR